MYFPSSPQQHTVGEPKQTIFVEAQARKGIKLTT